MKNTKKVASNNKRRKKGHSPSRATGQPQIHRGGAAEPAEKQKTQPLGPVLPSSSGRKSASEEVERIRKLWECKQAELEERWVIAQSRQTERNNAHRRTMKMTYIAAGIVLLVLLCVLAWHFLQPDIYRTAP